MDANRHRFNSFTHEICIDDAVVIHPRPIQTPLVCNARQSEPNPGSSRGDPGCSRVIGNDEQSPGYRLRGLICEEAAVARPISQNVTYTARAVDNLADVIDALSISSSATINYGAAKFHGSTSIIKESVVNESDLNFIVSVKVTNEASIDLGHMEFKPIKGLDPGDFTAVYGDCFIAGFLDGGEFSAIISINVRDKGKVSRVKLAAEAQLLSGYVTQPPASDASLDKDDEDVWKGTQLNISVNWVGGGEIKRPSVNHQPFPSNINSY
jgi:hypothetical protein